MHATYFGLLVHTYIHYTYVCMYCTYAHNEGPSVQRLRDEGDFGTYKRVPEAMGSHNHPGAFDQRINHLERSHYEQMA
jgi:hypothetical protein